VSSEPGAGQGGHSVPRDRIIARWYRTMEMLHAAIATADRSYIFDNTESSTRPQLVFVSGSNNEWQVRPRSTSPTVPLWVRRYVLSHVASDAELEYLDVPATQRRSLMQLNDHTCKWPIGDIGSAEFFFCGGLVANEGPYCAYHARKAYQPASSHKRPPALRS
jgi:hypothetical protein